MKKLNRGIIISLAAVCFIGLSPTFVSKAAGNPLHTSATISGKADSQVVTYTISMDKSQVTDGRVAVVYDQKVLELKNDSETKIFSDSDVNKNYKDGDMNGISYAFILLFCF